MLEDDIPFNETSQLIIDLSKDISSEFEEEMGKRIEELKKRELVRTRSSMDVIQINNESLMVKLVETGNNEKVDGNNEIWIKLGLTRYVRQLARSLEVDVLLQELKAQGVINDTLKRKIEQRYNCEEQMQLLVIHMMDETRENLLKLCGCLRKVNTLLADLVQHKPSDEKEIEENLRKEQRKKIMQILQDFFIEEDTSSVACEDVHIFVEEKRKCTTTFQFILECVKECFLGVTFEENDSRFHGIKPKDETLFGEEEITEGQEEVLTDMPSDRFCTYLAKKMEETRTGIGCHFEETVLEECISAKIFAKLTDEQMEENFSPRLKEANIKFGLGIKSALSEVRQNIGSQMNRISTGEADTLRKFDTPAENIRYTKSTVRPAMGNLLTAYHEFIYPALKKQCNPAFMAKEVMRFALACINGRKNGTIHFGIKETGNGTGAVVGLPGAEFSDSAALNTEIHSCIKNCIDTKYQMFADRCIRPAQVIPVEEDMVVMEVDVVPFSGHIQETCIQIQFPPKGNQRQKCFVYEENMIVTIAQSKLKFVEEDFRRLFEERVQLEKELAMPNVSASNRTTQKLKKLLTGGNKFITDAFIPVICSGNMSGCLREAEIRESMVNMSIAFTTSAGVFDFDSSVDLRYLIENENNYFQVKVPEDFISKRCRRESDKTGESKIWLYSNGNEELRNERMETELWYSKRLAGVRAALDQIRQQIPVKRGLVIFLVFQTPIEQDPMLEIARETFLKTFKDECIVIAENDELLQDWRREMKGRLTKQDFESKTVTGLSWEDTASIVKSVFHPGKNVLYKFPDSRGHIVEMTIREMEDLQLQTIELVDGYAGEHCHIQEDEDTDENCCFRRSKEQENFYKGNDVTWWNFYYLHVGKRDKYDLHKQEIKYKLRSTDSIDRYETHQIEHNPGAGGSTLARHIIWHFSQIKQTPDETYRCCIVNRITDDTAEEIYRFKTFKDKSGTKPVIVLIDNKSEEHLNLLKARVDEVAYKKGSPGKLFCLLVTVTRVPVSHVSREMVLEHDLSKKEKMWFDNKFKELDSNTDVNVKTLIAFNVMRESFDPKFIEETTKELMGEITPEEKKLLEVLSLICSFDSDSPIPETVFDSLMHGVIYDPNILKLEQCMNRPFGIVWSEKERRAMRRVDRETWNVNLTGAMQLLITHRKVNSDTHFNNGVCILSQPLSKAVMSHIMYTEEKSFEDMVDNVLQLLDQHGSETNAMSKLFIKIVCSLFTYRESFKDEKGENKVAKFSALVLHLEKQIANENAEQAQNRVIKVMTKCFDVSGNAMVGQQLARYHYHIKNFMAAEDVIKRCLDHKPQNSYLLDTYGQIFKSKMEHIIGSKSSVKMNNTESTECIELAYKAVEKFKLAQAASTTLNEDNASFNSNCFYMEVITALYLLENFHRFECFGDKQTFWSFLNDKNFSINGSSYEHILREAPVLEQFRNGRDTHHHIERSLRTLEEKAYMTRNYLTTVITPSKDLLLLKPRERFELFYGSKEHTLQFEFLYGVGLKLLMKCYHAKESRQKLVERARKAELRLDKDDTTELERDLLVYLGYSIIEISKQEIEIDLGRYRKLVNYSARLWEIQRVKGPKERHYVEAYLYYALLHWILPSRTESGLENLSHPDTYNALLRQWDKAYMANNYIKSKDQLFKQKPKIYFALGNGSAGNDIVDLEWLRHKWREAMLKEGRTRREVKADNHWQHDIFEESLKRLSGIVDISGRRITTEVQYNNRVFAFQIHTLENCSEFSNRVVTFVLGFSWMELVALDVRRTERTFKRQTSQKSPENSEENLVTPQLVSQRSAKSEEQVNLRNENQQGISSGHHMQSKEQLSSIEKGYVIPGTKPVSTTLPADVREKGKGRGFEIYGARPKPKNINHAGHNVPKEHGPSHSSTHPVVTSVVSPDLKASSELPGKNITEAPKASALTRTVTEEGSRQSQERDTSEDWCQVRSKKKDHVIKNKKQIAAVAETPAPIVKLTPQERFEQLISTCEQRFPHSSRKKIISAYSAVKKIHKGNIKRLGTENIIKEIDKHLNDK
ncbi:uncharacterized protein LOC123539788 isoform X2 [Mercenaria mercenaria]|nr:uncharacterized protein LOC123539788 isoform X2 [Mercenaria mercenaria]